MSFGEFLAGISNTSTFLPTVADRVGSLFDYNIEPTQSELDAQSDGNKERAQIYGDNKALSSGFSGEYASQVFPQAMESFVDMDHSRIIKFVESINIGQMTTSIDGWTALADNTRDKAKLFRDNIQNEMERGWAGSAASSALSSTNSYLTEINKVEQAARLIGNKMAEARSGFQQVKYSVPHESDKQSTTVAGIVVSALSNVVAPGLGSTTALVMDSTSAGRADAAEAAARQVMTTVYKPVAEQSDTQVPKVPTPTKPQSDKPTGDTTKDELTGTTTDNNNNNNNNNNKKPSTEDTTPSTTEPETPTTDPGDDDTTDDQTTDDTTGDETTAATTTPETPTATTPSGTTPGTTPAGTSPGGLGSGGGAGAGAGAGASGGAGAGTPGAAVPGTAGQKQGAGTGAGAGSGASSGRAGTSGMGGMGAPGARGGGKDDENEHQAPDYLRGVHEELLGPERLHVPPVIGGDA
ncbi:hypothetical protein QX204_00890 [Nocardia sp. PE-7]|uniref:hypothetical protein n=1 Tax=Nocardia sp. PE-7 TaxID=3058426 RepID=UPI00265A7963|nr:hypothetical protein [Nocardia sp. PE-7]WKG10098.1 hypothetical protein QX204_00890 [Nocardia sp. PE-7]